jgi:glutamine amidotransferase
VWKFASGKVLLSRALDHRALKGEPGTVARAVPRGFFAVEFDRAAHIWATAWGDTLFWRTTEHGTVVASEPYDERPEWREAPDHTVLVASRNGVDVEPLRPARKETAAP